MKMSGGRRGSGAGSPEGSHLLYQLKCFCEEESGIEAGESKGRIQKPYF